jgi:hypothetical protein
MDLRRSNATGGLDGLLKSGAATLESDAEIREVVQMIVAHGEKDPVGGDTGEHLRSIDLSRFFRHASSNQVNFLQTRVDDAVRDFKASV